MSQEQVNRKLSCILSADVVGYSRLMEENEASTVRYLENNKKLLTRVIEEHNGRVIDSPGDNLLAEFRSAVKAVDCAVKIQKELKIKNTELVENRRMQFRIGINLGDVIEENGRLYGSGVNIAARLERLAEPGGICISRNVYDQVKTKLDLGYEYLGEQSVKNIAEPVRVYRVQTGIAAATRGVNKRVYGGLFSKRNIAITIVLILAGILVWKVYPTHRIKTGTKPNGSAQALGTPDVKEAPKTIAVLPFVNLSSDPEQEYFVDGLSEEIINSLTQIPDLGVTGRTSSFAFKGSKKTIQEIANILGVDHILEGSVRKSGDALRITAQLVRASDGLYLWSKIYDYRLKDIFAVQENIATTVAGELKINLGVGLSLKSSGGTKNIEAYNLYLTALGIMREGVVI